MAQGGNMENMEIMMKTFFSICQDPMITSLLASAATPYQSPQAAANSSIAGGLSGQLSPSAKSQEPSVGNIMRLFNQQAGKTKDSPGKITGHVQQGSSSTEPPQKKFRKSEPAKRTQSTTLKMEVQNLRSNLVSQVRNVSLKQDMLRKELLSMHKKIDEILNLLYIHDVKQDHSPDSAGPSPSYENKLLWPDDNDVVNLDG